jgi:hypothetical protein
MDLLPPTQIIDFHFIKFSDHFQIFSASMQSSVSNRMYLYINIYIFTHIHCLSYVSTVATYPPSRVRGNMNVRKYNK